MLDNLHTVASTGYHDMLIKMLRAVKRAFSEAKHALDEYEEHVRTHGC